MISDASCTEIEKNIAAIARSVEGFVNHQLHHKCASSQEDIVISTHSVAHHNRLVALGKGVIIVINLV